MYASTLSIQPVFVAHVGALLLIHVTAVWLQARCAPLDAVAGASLSALAAVVRCAVGTRAAWITSPQCTSYSPLALAINRFRVASSVRKLRGVSTALRPRGSTRALWKVPFKARSTAVGWGPCFPNFRRAACKRRQISAAVSFPAAPPRMNHVELLRREMLAHAASGAKRWLRDACERTQVISGAFTATFFALLCLAAEQSRKLSALEALCPLLDLRLAFVTAATVVTRKHTN